MKLNYYIIEICSDEMGKLKFVGRDSVHFIRVNESEASRYNTIEDAEIAAIKFVKYNRLPSYTPVKIHHIGYIDTPRQFTAGFDVDKWKNINLL